MVRKYSRKKVLSLKYKKKRSKKTSRIRKIQRKTIKKTVMSMADTKYKIT